MESARVLRDGVQFPAQSTETTSVDAVAMSCRIDIWTSLVDGRVDHVRGSIQQSDFAALKDFTLFVDSNKIGLVDEGEGDTEWIDPESVWLNGIAESDVASNALIFLELESR
jgi:hypothetical protein